MDPSLNDVSQYFPSSFSLTGPWESLTVQGGVLEIVAAFKHGPFHIRIAGKVGVLEVGKAGKLRLAKIHAPRKISVLEISLGAETGLAEVGMLREMHVLEVGISFKNTFPEITFSRKMAVLEIGFPPEGATRERDFSLEFRMLKSHQFLEGAIGEAEIISEVSAVDLISPRFPLTAGAIDDRQIAGSGHEQVVWVEIAQHLAREGAVGEGDGNGNSAHIELLLTGAEGAFVVLQPHVGQAGQVQVALDRGILVGD